MEKAPENQKSASKKIVIIGMAIILVPILVYAADPTWKYIKDKWFTTLSSGPPGGVMFPTAKPPEQGSTE